MRWIPNPLSNSDVVSSGDSVSFVLKFDQPSNEFTFWLNPNLNTTENNQDPGIKFSRITDPGVLDVDSIIMQTGTSAQKGSTAFSNIEFNDGLDTPFAVPEPSSYALIIGSLVLGLGVIRSRRQH